MIASQLALVVQQPQYQITQPPVVSAKQQVPAPQTPVVAHPEHSSLEAAHESELALAMTGKPLPPQPSSQPPQQSLMPADVYVQQPQPQTQPTASQSRHRADSGSRSPAPSDDESLAALQPAPYHSCCHQGLCEPTFSAKEEGGSQQLAQVIALARVDLCSGAGPPVDVRDPFRALDFALT